MWNSWNWTRLALWAIAWTKVGLWCIGRFKKIKKNAINILVNNPNPRSPFTFCSLLVGSSTWGVSAFSLGDIKRFTILIIAIKGVSLHYHIFCKHILALLMLHLPAKRSGRGKTIIILSFYYLRTHHRRWLLLLHLIWMRVQSTNHIGIVFRTEPATQRTNRKLLYLEGTSALHHLQKELEAEAKNKSQNQLSLQSSFRLVMCSCPSSKGTVCNVCMTANLVPL